MNITAVPTVSQMIGVTRILRGQSVPNVLGDSQLQKNRENLLRKKYIFRALEILQMDMKDKKIFSLDGAE